MRPFIIVIGALYFATKLLVRWWWFRPTYLRPGFVRHNEALRTLDLMAVVELLATFFLMVNSFSLKLTIVITAGMLAYDVMLRGFFLHLEVRRMCAASSKWSYRQARRRVRSRARRSSAI